MALTVELFLLICVANLCITNGEPPKDPPHIDEDLYGIKECLSLYDGIGLPTGYAEMLDRRGITVQFCEKTSKGKKTPQQKPSFAVLFDWKLRIPLWVQMSITDFEKRRGGGRIPFVESPVFDVQYQAEESMYYGVCSKVTLTYEQEEIHQLKNDVIWDPENPGGHTEMSRGHLLANHYKLDQPGADTVFRFTNIVPQFEAINSGPWAKHEQWLLNPWMKFCKKQKATLYITVGSVPSVGIKTLKLWNDNDKMHIVTDVEPRWFGKEGFGDGDFRPHVNYDGDEVHPDDATSDYRANVPAATWTAACCVGEDKQGNIRAYHTGFAGFNTPRTVGSKDSKKIRYVVRGSITTLLNDMLPENKISVFPNLGECTNEDNYREVTVDVTRWPGDAKGGKKERKSDDQREDMKSDETMHKHQQDI